MSEEIKTVIEKLDDLFINKYNHSKVLIEYENKKEAIKLIYRERNKKCSETKAVAIYFYDNKLGNVTTNYDVPVILDKPPTLYDVHESLEILLKENIK